MLRKRSALLCVILITVLTLRIVQAVDLQLTLTVDEKYDLGEEISICGNLTQDGSPVIDGLVTIQIDDPQDDLFVLRTLNTGSTPSGPWSVEILDFITCDGFGNPQSNFEADGNLGIKMNVRNNGGNTQCVNITVNFCDSNVLPYLALLAFKDWTLAPGYNETRTLWPIPIPYDAEAGQAIAYASVLDGWPENGGLALSPEKSATFNIGGRRSGTYTTEETCYETLGGEFNLTFRTNPMGGRTGNYSVSAVSFYQWSYTTSQATFEVYLLGDVNGDGKVRVDDILAVASAFGLDEGDPGWNPLYDLAPPPDGDGKIRVDDVLVVASAFGKHSEQ